MTGLDVISKKISLIRASRIDYFFPYYLRHRLRLVYTMLAVGAGLFTVIVFLTSSSNLPILLESFFGNLDLRFISTKFFGLFLFFGSISWLLILVEFYFLSTSRKIPFLINSGNENKKIYYLDFGGARKLMYLGAFHVGHGFEVEDPEKELDFAKIYKYFNRSSFIKILPNRLGISTDDFNTFVSNNVIKLPITVEQLFEMLIIEANEAGSDTIGARECLLVLFDLDKGFQDFLFEKGIHKDELSGASYWVERGYQLNRAKRRWWEKSELSRIQGVAKNFGFGSTFILDKYTHEQKSLKSSHLRSSAHKKITLRIEEILSRSGHANVLIYGETGVGKHTIIEELTRLIKNGLVFPALEHKRVLYLDAHILRANADNSSRLETVLIQIFNDAITAGNILLVIENFSEFLKLGSELGVNVESLIAPYLEGSRVQVIALTDKDSFHRTLENRGRFTKLFDLIEINEPDLNEIELILEDVAEELETTTGVYITYPAIQETVSLSDRFITRGVMPEKAINFIRQSFVLCIYERNKRRNPRNN